MKPSEIIIKDSEQHGFNPVPLMLHLHLYPIVIQHAQQSKVIGSDEGQEYDYKLINQLVTNGKLAEMIMQEGKM